jgi:hypothetical protein
MYSFSPANAQAHQSKVALSLATTLGTCLPRCDAERLGVGILAGGYSKGELEESGVFRVYADPKEMLLHIEDLGIECK